ncbi:MAG TPA: hypothetical protein DCP63_02950, partial [Bacteroidetes bacterium]|nr:hypothetical protein [Bacteroidota bacterium]
IDILRRSRSSDENTMFCHKDAKARRKASNSLAFCDVLWLGALEVLLFGRISRWASDQEPSPILGVLVGASAKYQNTTRMPGGGDEFGLVQGNTIPPLDFLRIV